MSIFHTLCNTIVHTKIHKSFYNNFYAYSYEGRAGIVRKHFRRTSLRGSAQQQLSTNLALRTCRRFPETIATLSVRASQVFRGVRDIVPQTPTFLR